MTDRTLVPIDGPDVADLIDPLTRYARGHSRTPEEADDVVQEVLTRMLSAKDGLSSGSTIAYALVTARHVIVDRARDAARLQRNRHRIIDLREPQRPDDAVVQGVEAEALQKALAGIPTAQRETLLAHVLGDQPVASIAAGTSTSSGSVAAQLARTRARLRLDYVLALRRTVLPTERCRPILLALSAGDVRRQTALRAGQHLLACSTCAAIAPPLLTRQRSLAAVVPWLGLGPLLPYIRRAVRQSASATGTAVATASALTVLVAVSSPAVAPPALSVSARAGTTAPASVTAPGPAAPGVSTAALAMPRPASAVEAVPAAVPGRLVRVRDGRTLLPPPADLAQMDGDEVSATSVRVSDVPADEGFWIGGARGHVWVQLDTRGAESQVAVQAGDTVSFVGEVVAHSADFADRAGVGTTDGKAALRQAGAHLAVSVGALTSAGRSG